MWDEPRTAEALEGAEWYACGWAAAVAPLRAAAWLEASATMGRAQRVTEAMGHADGLNLEEVRMWATELQEEGQWNVGAVLERMLADVGLPSTVIPTEGEESAGEARAAVVMAEFMRVAENFLLAVVPVVTLVSDRREAEWEMAFAEPVGGMDTDEEHGGGGIRVPTGEARTRMATAMAANEVLGYATRATPEERAQFVARQLGRVWTTEEARSAAEGSTFERAREIGGWRTVHLMHAVIMSVTGMWEEGEAAMASSAGALTERRMVSEAETPEGEECM
eukprot:6605717-Prymnesium_polylepis.1